MAITGKASSLPGTLYVNWDSAPCYDSIHSTSFHKRRLSYVSSHTRDRRIKPSFPALFPTNRGTVIRAFSQSNTVRDTYKVRKWCGALGVYVLHTGRQDRFIDMPAGGLYNNEPTNLADTNALLSVRENLLNLSDTLAEFRETAGMFGDFAVGVRDIYRASRGRMRRRRLRPTDTTSANLAMSFGISPLVGNFYDSLLHFKDRLNYDIIRRCVGYDKVSVFKSYDGGINNHWYRVQSEFQFRTVLYVRVSPYATDRIDFGNPLRWAWELIPFSFIVDWGINVGDTLAALDRLPGITLAKGTRSVQAEHSAEFGLNDLLNSRQKYYQTLSPGKQATWSYKRNVLSSFPMPDRPQWRPGASFRKLANASSILAQLKRDMINDFFRR